MKFWIFLIVASSVWATATVDSYLAAFPDLQKREDWGQIASLGEEALLSEPTEAEAAQIHGHLASSYFYRGQFEPAEAHARSCYEIGCRLSLQNEQVPKAQIQGLYLLSAMARARGEFSTAKAIARLALPLSSGELKGKVLFNLGAAEAEDPQGDLAVAESAFKEAIELFSCELDQQRCAIRLGKIYLLRGAFGSTRSLLEEIVPQIKNERIGMHASYLAAQMEKAEGNREKAKEIALSALESARKLDAKKDAERIEKILETL